MFDRYKEMDWAKDYRRSRVRLKVFINGPGCNNVIASEAQHMLKAHYKGPWKMLAAVTKRELESLWLCYGWAKWEWIRVKVFRLPEDEAIAEAKRVEAEGSELMRIGQEL